MEFKVSKKKIDELKTEFLRLKIFENDIEETFVKAGGAGGQKINKTSVKVKLKHLPTNIIVECAKERSQNLNRFFARRILIEKIDEKINGKASKKNQLFQKKKKQKVNKKRKAKKKYG
jgi:protein subunit release factor B